MFEKGKPYYDAYSRELVASFKQAQQVHLDQAGGLQLSDEPTIEETRGCSTCWNWNSLARSANSTSSTSSTSSARPSGPRTPIRDR